MINLFTTKYYPLDGRCVGKESLADILTQEKLLQMKTGQIFCLASARGIKYFRCFEPNENKLKFTYDGADCIKSK